jgi:hypothetical protein
MRDCGVGGHAPSGDHTERIGRRCLGNTSAFHDVQRRGLHRRAGGQIRTSTDGCYICVAQAAATYDYVCAFHIWAKGATTAGRHDKQTMFPQAWLWKGVHGFPPASGKPTTQFKRILAATFKSNAFVFREEQVGSAQAFVQTGLRSQLLHRTHIFKKYAILPTLLATVALGTQGADGRGDCFIYTDMYI